MIKWMKININKGLNAKKESSLNNNRNPCIPRVFVKEDMLIYSCCTTDKKNKPSPKAWFVR